MSIEFTQPKNFTYMSSPPSPGYLALEVDPKIELSWYGCREQFHPVFVNAAPDVGIYYSHEPGKDEVIATFIDRTEEILRFSLKEMGLQEEVPSSKFAKTNRPFAMWIGPSLFWAKCPMRRSMFTALVRAAQRGYRVATDTFPDNYEEALFNCQYFSNTREATMRFLFGFTVYVDDNIAFGQGARQGWQSCFYGKDRTSTKKQLVAKPEDIKTYKDTLPTANDAIGFSYDTLFR